MLAGKRGEQADAPAMAREDEEMTKGRG